MVADAGTIGPGAWPRDGEQVVEEFRSSSSRPLALTWWAVSGLVLLDLALSGRDHLALTIAVGILASDLLLWLGAWRPGVRLYREHLVLRGSVRDRSLTLASITSATANGPLLLYAGDRRFASPAVGTTVRQRRRAGRQSSSVPMSFGGNGGLGGRRAAPSVPLGFDDSKMDPATRDALAGRTPGAYAAERITADASRLRRAGGLTTEQAAAGLDTQARWVGVPAAAAAALVLVFVLVAALG